MTYSSQIMASLVNEIKLARTRAVKGTRESELNMIERNSRVTDITAIACKSLIKNYSGRLRDAEKERLTVSLSMLQI